MRRPPRAWQARSGRALAAWLVLAWTAWAGASLAVRAALPVGGVRVVSQEEDAGLRLAVQNTNLAAVTLTVTVMGDNAKADRSMPVVVTCPGPGTFPFVLLTPVDDSRGFGYKVRFDWQFGASGAKHARKTVYELPFASGQRFQVSQGFKGSFTHSGANEFAVDFDMPEGTPIHAAREGTVEVVVDWFTGGGVDPELRDRVNFILVRHPDGTYGEYVHLRPGGAAVKPGRKVAARELLGYSGFTGYAQGPHLHFAVFRSINGTERETFPMRFRTAEGKAVEPEEKRFYTAP